MDDIQKLIEEARALIRSPVTVSKGRRPEAIIYRNTPTGILAKQSKIADFTTISVFRPSKLPTGYPETASIVLHAHWWYEPCQSHLFCHEVNYTPIGSEEGAFFKIWGYLYNEKPGLEKTTLDLRLG